MFLVCWRCRKVPPAWGRALRPEPATPPAGQLTRESFPQPGHRLDLGLAQESDLYPLAALLRSFDVGTRVLVL